MIKCRSLRVNSPKLSHRRVCLKWHRVAKRTPKGTHLGWDHHYHNHLQLWQRFTLLQEMSFYLLSVVKSPARTKLSARNTSSTRMYPDFQRPCVTFSPLRLFALTLSSLGASACSCPRSARLQKTGGWCQSSSSTWMEWSDIGMTPRRTTMSPGPRLLKHSYSYPLILGLWRYPVRDKNISIRLFMD